MVWKTHHVSSRIIITIVATSNRRQLDVDTGYVWHVGTLYYTLDIEPVRCLRQSSTMFHCRLRQIVTHSILLVLYLYMSVLVCLGTTKECGWLPRDFFFFTWRISSLVFCIPGSWRSLVISPEFSTKSFVAVRWLVFPAISIYWGILASAYSLSWWIGFWICERKKRINKPFGTRALIYISIIYIYIEYWFGPEGKIMTVRLHNFHPKTPRSKVILDNTRSTSSSFLLARHSSVLSDTQRPTKSQTITKNHAVGASSLVT